MDEQTFQAELSKLMDEISTLPEAQRRKFQDVAEATQDRRDRVRETVADLQEGLDYLRLSIKYLMFDLEATRRENDYLRGMLEQDVYGEDPDGEAI